MHIVVSVCRSQQRAHGSVTTNVNMGNLYRVRCVNIPEYTHYMYIWVCICVCIYIYIYIYNMQGFFPTCIYMYVYIFTHTHARTNILLTLQHTAHSAHDGFGAAYIHTYIHTYIYMHTYRYDGTTLQSTRDILQATTDGLSSRPSTKASRVPCLTSDMSSSKQLWHGSMFAPKRLMYEHSLSLYVCVCVCHGHGHGHGRGKSKPQRLMYKSVCVCVCVCVTVTAAENLIRHSKMYMGHAPTCDLVPKWLSCIFFFLPGIINRFWEGSFLVVWRGLAASASMPFSAEISCKGLGTPWLTLSCV
jgi:hypothetical protein